MTIDTARLRDYMHHFYGYGSWDAPLWLVGMEEGGDATESGLAARLAAWDGTDALADLHTIHRNLRDVPWFGDRPVIQPTWGKLIRIALAAAGEEITTESIRPFQAERLGRTGEISHWSTAVIELFPLPAASVKHWPYSALGLPELTTRDRYRDHLRALRIRSIRDHLHASNGAPRAVIFYGKAYRKEWEQIAGHSFTRGPETGIETCASARTLFILTRHPAARGATNEEFDAVGRFVAQRAP